MTFTPRSSAAWIVAMLSASSLGPYQLPAPMPMHPSAIGNASGPVLPNALLCSFARVMPSNLDRKTRTYLRAPRCRAVGHHGLHDPFLAALRVLGVLGHALAPANTAAKSAPLAKVMRALPLP